MGEEREKEILKQLEALNRIEGKAREMMNVGSTYDWSTHSMRKRNLKRELSDIRERRIIGEDRWADKECRRERVNEIIIQVCKHNLDMGKYLNWIRKWDI